LRREPCLIPSTLQRYVLKETFRVAALSFLALTGMIFIGMAVELIRSGLSVIQLRDLIPYVLAYTLPYALPSSLLVACVFVFGRMSGQNEISAISAGGVNLNHVISPLIIVGLVISLAGFGLNQYLLPWSHNRVTRLKRTVVKSAIRYVGATHTKFEVGDYLIYVGGIDKDGFWKNCALVKFAHDYPALILLADRGHCTVDEDRGVAHLRLYNGNVFQPRLNEGTGEPVFQFKETRYDLNLAESAVPEVGLTPEDVALIKRCVRRALDHASLLPQTRRFADKLLFFKRAETDGSWRNVSLIEFSDEKVPLRLTLADSALYRENPDSKSAVLTLLRAREFPVINGGLPDKPTRTLEQRTVAIDTDAPLTIPSIGTDPHALWFSTRPKYLILPDLLDARRARKAKADELRRMPEYRDIKHPSSRRRLLEASEGKLYRKYARCLVDLKPLSAAAEKIAAAVAATKEKIRLLRAREKRLREKSLEIDENLQERKRAIRQLRLDIDRLTADKASTERLRAKRDRIRQFTRIVEQLETDARQVRSQIHAASQELSRLQGLLEVDQAKLKTANARVAAQRKKADAAKADYEKLKKRVLDIKLIEKHLRAETTFHFRNAGAATTLIFMFIGIPLGILSKRGNVIIAFALSFFTVLIIYYPLMMVGQMLSRDGFMTPWLALWMADIVIAALGLALMKWAVKR